MKIEATSKPLTFGKLFICELLSIIIVYYNMFIVVRNTIACCQLVFNKQFNIGSKKPVVWIQLCG